MTPRHIPLALRGYRALAWLFLAGVVIQFFFAGMGVLVDPAWLGAHRMLPLLLLAFGPLLLVCGALGRLPPAALGATALLLVLVVAQWLVISLPPMIGVPALRALHTIVALGIFSVATRLLAQVRQFSVVARAARA